MSQHENAKECKVENKIAKCVCKSGYKGEICDEEAGDRFITQILEQLRLNFWLFAQKITRLDMIK